MCILLLFFCRFYGDIVVSFWRWRLGSRHCPKLRVSISITQHNSQSIWNPAAIGGRVTGLHLPSRIRGGNWLVDSWWTTWTVLIWRLPQWKAPNWRCFRRLLTSDVCYLSLTPLSLSLSVFHLKRFLLYLSLSSSARPQFFLNAASRQFASLLSYGTLMIWWSAPVGTRVTDEISHADGLKVRRLISISFEPLSDLLLFCFLLVRSFCRFVARIRKNEVGGV